MYSLGYIQNEKKIKDSLFKPVEVDCDYVVLFSLCCTYPDSKEQNKSLLISILISNFYLPHYCSCYTNNRLLENPYSHIMSGGSVSFMVALILWNPS